MVGGEDQRFLKIRLRLPLQRQWRCCITEFHQELLFIVDHLDIIGRRGMDIRVSKATSETMNFLPLSLVIQRRQARLAN